MTDSTTSIPLEFGDGEYTFALPLPHIAELQRKTGCGVAELFGRLAQGCFINPVDNEVHIDAKMGKFYALDIIETIRHGLIGGGQGLVNGEEVKVDAKRANELVELYVADQPFIRNWNLAVSILGAKMMGYEPPKKGQPPREGAEAEAADTSTTDEPGQTSRQ